MKILLINQFFWPDGAPTSVLLTDLARHLDAEGHDVTVICGPAGYHDKGSSSRPLVMIKRSWAAPFGRGILQRLASYASFYASAVWKGLRNKRPDVVVTLTTPPLAPLIGTLLKRRHGAQHIIWEMDMYPDVAVATGLVKQGSAIERIIGKAADYARRHADGIIALGECMARRLEARGVERERISVAENWADGDKIFPGPWPQDYRLHVLYSGNFGMAHDTETIGGALKVLKDHDNLAFRFAGRGKGHQEIKKLAMELDAENVEFDDYVPAGEFLESLWNAHVGLVTQKKNCSGVVVPSKVYTLMAAGRPVLFIGPRDATPARIVRDFQCGWHVECGDVKGLVALLETLAEQGEVVRAAGRRARAAFLEHYDIDRGVARVSAAIGCPAEAKSSKN